MRRAALPGIAWLVAPSIAHAEPPPTDPTTVTVRAGSRPVGPSLTLSAEQAAQGAGTQGDPVKALQSLPGLGRGGPASDFVAWGSEPRESRFEIDGVEVPRLYHGSGLRSVVLPVLIDSVSVSPGAFAIDHGRANGGLVELRTRPLPLTAMRLGASVDMLDAGAFASAPVAAGRAAAFAGARYGYADRWLKGIIDPRVRGLYQVPSYWDASAAVELARPRGGTARLVAVTSSDAESFEVSSQDPSLARRSDRTARFGRLYVLYRAHGGDGGETEVTPFIGWDHAQGRELNAGRASELDISSLSFGLRAQYRSQLTSGLRLTLGLDAVGSSSKVSRTGSLSVPRREGDPYPFATPPGYGTATDDFRATRIGLGSYAELEIRAGPVSVAPALRIEPGLIEVSRTRPPLGTLPDIGASRVALALEPRLFAEARLSRAAKIFAAAGLYHQPPDPADSSARFGNPSLGSSRATHVAFGENAQLAARTRVELTIFSKWLSDLAVRSPDPEPRLGQALIASGEGRAYGAQLFVRQGMLHDISGWISITLSRSERRSPGSAYRLSDHDSPLALALVLEKTLGLWRLATRARFASGAPRTPVIGAFYDTATSAYQPELGPLNSARLRSFVQIDLRIDRRFTLPSDTKLDLYLDLLNVTFQRNQEQLIYSSDFRTIGSVSSLPPLAVLGVKVER